MSTFLDGGDHSPESDQQERIAREAGEQADGAEPDEWGMSGWDYTGDEDDAREDERHLADDDDYGY